MVQRHNRFHSIVQQFVNQIAVIPDSLFVHRPIPIREYPAPCYGKAVGIKPHLLHKGDVFPEMMVLVACHLRGGKPKFFKTILVNDILLAGFLAVFVSRTFHLIGAGAGPP